MGDFEVKQTGVNEYAIETPTDRLMVAFSLIFWKK
jgi:hypothetical protein